MKKTVESQSTLSSSQQARGIIDLPSRRLAALLRLQGRRAREGRLYGHRISRPHQPALCGRRKSSPVGFPDPECPTCAADVHRDYHGAGDHGQVLRFVSGRGQLLSLCLHYGHQRHDTDPNSPGRKSRSGLCAVYGHQRDLSCLHAGCNGHWRARSRRNSVPLISSRGVPVCVFPAVFPKDRHARGRRRGGHARDRQRCSNRSGDVDRDAWHSRIRIGGKPAHWPGDVRAYPVHRCLGQAPDPAVGADHRHRNRLHGRLACRACGLVPVSFGLRHRSARSSLARHPISVVTGDDPASHHLLLCHPGGHD